MHKTSFLYKYMKLYNKLEPLLGRSNFKPFLPYASCTQNGSTKTNIQQKIEQKNDHSQAFQNLMKNLSYDTISNEQAEKLFTKFGDNIIDVSNISRNELCQRLYENLLKNDKVDLNILHTYIRVCTENEVKLKIENFLTKVINCKLSEETYKLLLTNASENGDTAEALKILDLMKSESVPLDEYVFNNLVLLYSISGGLAGAEQILNTMKSAKINETVNTKFAMLRGLSRQSNLEDFQVALKKYGFKMDEYRLLDIITELGRHNVDWISKIQLPNEESVVLTKQFRNFLKQKCIHLVHINQSDAAIAIFHRFFMQKQEENHGFFILEEMLQCNYDTKSILSAITKVQGYAPEEHILERILGMALALGKTEISWALLELSPKLRPHYFWPLLIHAYKAHGEPGVFHVVLKMKKMNVHLDFETWAHYVFPYSNLDQYQLLVTNLQKDGFTVKDIMTPLLCALIANGKLKAALHLYSLYNVKLYGDGFLKYVSKAWYSTKDSESTVLLLQKYCESNGNKKDFVGEFLIGTLKLCIKQNDLQDFNGLLKIIRKQSLKILQTSAESLQAILASHHDSNSVIVTNVEDGINAILDFGMKSNSSHIPHPNDMSLEELECHLLELQEKNMNTRGVLRKLILLHSNIGNTERVQELRSKCSDEGFEESTGMKSSILHAFVLGKHTEAALDIYREIKTSNPNFNLDDYKILDLCTILVKDGRTSQAWDIIKQEARIKKNNTTEGIRRNCMELLDALKKEDEQFEMFNFLVDNKYCKPENIILGPLVSNHLTNGNIMKACETYLNLSKKYKCTPFQFELIKALVIEKNEELLNKILQSTAEIHGSSSTQATLIGAVAEIGNDKALAKILAKNSINVQHYLKQRCDRWVKEGKPEALMTLLSAFIRVGKHVDLSYFIRAVMEIYKFHNDLEGVSKLYEYLMEKEIVTSQLEEIQRTLQDMQKKPRRVLN